MDQPQALQGQQVVDLVDRLGEGDDGRGVAAGGEQPRVRQLLFDPADDAVDQPGEAEDEAGVDRRAGRAADRLLRLFEFDPGDPGGAVDQRGQRELEAGADRAAEVLAVGGDRVDVDPGAEVDETQASPKRS